MVRNDRTHVVDLQEALLIRGRQRLPAAEMRRETARRGFTDLAHAEREKKAREARRLARLQRSDKIIRAFFPHAVK